MSVYFTYHLPSFSFPGVRAISERLPADAPPRSRPATIERAAEILGELIDAGFQGFTFRNPNLSTPELIGLAGDLKKMLP